MCTQQLRLQRRGCEIISLHQEREDLNVMARKSERNLVLLQISLMLEYGVAKSCDKLPLTSLSHVHIPLHVSVRRLTVHESILFSGRYLSRCLLLRASLLALGMLMVLTRIWYPATFDATASLCAVCFNQVETEFWAGEDCLLPFIVVIF